MTNELSSDIILNILSRMPAKSLARFRCVINGIIFYFLIVFNVEFCKLISRLIREKLYRYKSNYNIIQTFVPFTQKTIYTKQMKLQIQKIINYIHKMSFVANIMSFRLYTSKVKKKNIIPSF